MDEKKLGKHTGSKALLLIMAICQAQGAVVVGERAGRVERVAASVLEERLVEGKDWKILLGVPSHHEQLRNRLERQRIRPVSEQDPGAEGFFVRSLPGEKIVLAAGVDERGVLYAVGEILRRGVAGLDVRTAPAFEVRGTQFGQSGVALTAGKVRKWTEAELRGRVIDLVLAGLNTVQVSKGGAAADPLYKIARELGLKTLLHFNPNAGSGAPEWAASESIGRTGYLCPSVAAARKALLEQCERRFRGDAPVDYVRFVGGDGGGCECDRCRPYGAVYIKLCADMAAIIQKIHPGTEFFATNQKFDNDGDLAIFDYLRKLDRQWLRAFAYGPGSDAMSWQPGHRQTHRMDLFRYPGFGPPARYAQEILHEMPRGVDLVFFNELTHWRYAQNGLIQQYPRADRNGDQPPAWNHFLYERHPDPALNMVYDRLTFFAWPRYYHWYFNQVMRYGIGDVTHSSGTQDHFNQWMWQRLLWAPQTKVEDVVAEYSQTWFGAEAASEMAEAIFQLEENLAEKPGVSIAAKDGIDRYFTLVSEAGRRMPANRMKTNWLWREYMQKAALDKHVQLSVRQQEGVQKRVEAAVRAGSTDAVIDGALGWLGGLRATPEMTALRREAERLGEESNRLYGVRNEGVYNLDHDFIGLGWMRRQLERARKAQGAERAELLHMITDYEDAGEGGYYDDAGVLGKAPNMVKGYPFDFGQPFVPEMLWESNRPSQRTMAYTQDEDQGVTLHYRGLADGAAYRIRFTLVRPWYQERYRGRMNQKSVTIYAGDGVLAKDLEVPEKVAEFFTFDVPREAVKNGELVVRFARGADVARGSRVEREVWRNSGGWGTIVSEAWLMKKK
ncbi:MAG: hypothetical protein JNK48_20815 [Bryobacterales bacterium]|nr:hypothetical protein [Bryobacterales bacterium]